MPVAVGACRFSETLNCSVGAEVIFAVLGSDLGNLIYAPPGGEGHHGGARSIWRQFLFTP